MPEFSTWIIYLINQLGEIGEKQLSVLGSRGDQICPLCTFPFYFESSKNTTVKPYIVTLCLVGNFGPGTPPPVSKLSGSSHDSMYLIAVIHCRSFKISSIDLWKVLALPFKPNGIVVNMYCPYFVHNAVFWNVLLLNWDFVVPRGAVKS